MKLEKYQEGYCYIWDHGGIDGKGMPLPRKPRVIKARVACYVRPRICDNTGDKLDLLVHFEVRNKFPTFSGEIGRSAYCYDTHQESELVNSDNFFPTVSAADCYIGTGYIEY